MSIYSLLVCNSVKLETMETLVSSSFTQYYNE